MARSNQLVLTVGALLCGAICVSAAPESGTGSLPGGPGTSSRGSVEITAKDQGDTTAASPAAPRSRYRTLLKTIELPADQASYGDFCDYGFWAGTSYAGHDDLQPGYWVYLAPNWYIYNESASDPAAPPPAPRAWGPEQATGAPDTWPNAGDLQTAWASKTPDGQTEWLELTYDAPIRPTAVLIYETYNPGAVNRITGYNADGKEFNLWSGTDPTAAGSEKGISVIALHPEVDVTRIRVYLDSQKVVGWNEIDAVGLLDAAGTTHWAQSATASSTYAEQGSSPNIELEVERLGGNRLR